MWRTTNPIVVDVTAAGSPAARVTNSVISRKHGLSRDQARSLIERVGNDRAKLNAAAERIKGR